MTSSIIIKRGREKPILQQHPWIFSGAIDHVEGNPTPGDIVTVKSADGKFLARGYWNPKSQIQVRILTWHDEPIDDDWWRRMLKRSIEARLVGDYLNFLPENAHRLVNAENDFIPGLVVDRYANWFVIQALTLGIDTRKKEIANFLLDIWNSDWIGRTCKIKGVFERSDVDVRGKEGLKSEIGVLWGDEPPHLIKFREYEVDFLVDIRKGHKTGFYLDQAANRWILDWLVSQAYTLNGPADPCHILNLFSYTGAFGVYAFRADLPNDGPFVYVTNVDSSHEALKLAEANVKLNFQQRRYDIEHADFIQADVFDYLRDQVETREQYDIIVLDPPKFAHNAQQVEKAARGYKDINLNAFKLVKPGGYLMTFSCSGAVSADLFQKIVFGALADSGRQAQILKHLGPGDDHPVALTFPEGAYLKGLLLRVY